ARPAAGPAGAVRAPHRAAGGRRWTAEDEPGGAARLGERGVLGEEPVAGMDRVGAGRLRDVYEPLDVEVALGGGGGPDRVHLVGHEHMKRLAVRLGEDSGARDAGLAARAGQAHGDLAAVRDEDLRDSTGGHEPRLETPVAITSSLSTCKRRLHPV